MMIISRHYNEVLIIPINNGEKTKSRILDLLGNHPEGLTIHDIALNLKLHRQTVTKYLYELVGAKKIMRRQVGPATLHYSIGRMKK
jgi:DNA-binding IclR family transcriptional regulator